MKQESTGFGIASLVTSIIGLLGLIMPYFAIIFSIMAIVFAVIQNKRQRTGLATAGLVIGIIGTAINTIMLLLVMVFVLAAGAY